MATLLAGSSAIVSLGLPVEDEHNGCGGFLRGFVDKETPVAGHGILGVEAQKAAAHDVRREEATGVTGSNADAEVAIVAAIILRSGAMK